jgi:group II intron reverse transcriptase/maturase
MSARPTPQGKAVYAASTLDKSWLLTEQRKAHTRSMQNPDYVFGKLWGLITDPRNLRIAVERVARNRGARTAGVDGITVRRILRDGVDTFIAEVRSDLRDGSYRPSPVRRVLIPKAGQPGKFRPLGIPTVKDRVVQAAVKHILEPIFEADFYPTSYGFRPGRSVHGALEHLRMLLLPRKAGPDRAHRLPYLWAIEGDIKGCFDHIDHHGLMERVRRRVADPKVNRLIVAFLQAGILSEGSFLRSEAGTPQGGILSPLLANIALSVLDERYERHVRPRRSNRGVSADAASMEKRAMSNRSHDRRCGRPVCMPIRYADDFIILVGVAPGPEQEQRAEHHAREEKAAVAAVLKEQLGLELSEEKTVLTPVTKPLSFLGHHVRVRMHPGKRRLVSGSFIPRDRSQRFRERIKAMFRRSTTWRCLGDQLRTLNPMLRGFAYFYRHAWGAKRVFGTLDHYVWWTIQRWLRKKHGRCSMRKLARLYGWQKPGGHTLRWRDDGVSVFEMAGVRVGRFSLGWHKTPSFAIKSAESPVHSERCTPGSERGARKPPDESR